MLNPGSVGLPAYTDDAPNFYEMDSGSPHAKYALLTNNENVWSVEQIEVGYDWEAAANKAEKNGRNDWTGWLRTGKG